MLENFSVDHADDWGPDWTEASYIGSRLSSPWSVTSGYGQFVDFAEGDGFLPYGNMQQPMEATNAVEFTGSWMRVRGATLDSEQRCRFYLADVNEVGGILVKIGTPGAGGFEVIVSDPVGATIVDDYSTALTMDPETFYAFKVQVNSFTQTVRAKVWKVSDGEPFDWAVDLSGVDLSAFMSGDVLTIEPTSGGHGGIGSQMTRFDYIGAAPLAAPAASDSLISFYDGYA